MSVGGALVEPARVSIPEQPVCRVAIRVPGQSGICNYVRVLKDQPGVARGGLNDPPAHFGLVRGVDFKRDHGLPDIRLVNSGHRGRVGRDELGARALELLRNGGVDVSGVQQDDDVLALLDLLDDDELEALGRIFEKIRAALDH